jgi:hypothetical protein
MRHKILQTVLLACLLSTLQPAAQEATLVLYNAKVYTVDPKRRSGGSSDRAPNASTAAVGS